MVEPYWPKTEIIWIETDAKWNVFEILIVGLSWEKVVFEEEFLECLEGGGVGRGRERLEECHVYQGLCLYAGEEGGGGGGGVGEVIKGKEGKEGEEMHSW